MNETSRRGERIDNLLVLALWAGSIVATAAVVSYVCLNRVPLVKIECPQ